MNKSKLSVAAFSASAILMLSTGLTACKDIGLTADKWSSAMTNAMHCKNYTMTAQSDGFSMTIKSDLEKKKYSASQHSSSSTGYSATETVFAKDGEKYVCYARAYGVIADDPTGCQMWNLTELTETDFNQMTATYQNSALVTLLSCVKDKFDSFTYNRPDKTFYASGFDIENIGTAEEVTASFEDDELVLFIVSNLNTEKNDAKITYIYVDFNKTNIALPDKKDIQENALSLAGKTFVFESLTIGGEPDKASNEYYTGMTLTFTETTIIQTLDGQSTEGTYTVNGNAIVLTIDGHETPATYQAGKIVSTTQTMDGEMVITLTEQTA